MGYYIITNEGITEAIEVRGGMSTPAGVKVYKTQKQVNAAMVKISDKFLAEQDGVIEAALAEADADLLKHDKTLLGKIRDKVKSF